MTDLSIAHAAPPPAPFPWFGGKSKVAAPIWERLGPVSNYVEPFFGSGAVLLQRPQPFTGPETINDADGFVANAWRAIAADPEQTARHADWPVNECVPAGTMIATPSGDVPVEDINPGMVVWGEQDGTLVPTQVIATKQSTAALFYDIGQLCVTGNHPVWTSEHGYIEARHLAAGMHVARVNCVVNKLDLVMLHCEHEYSLLGNLRTNRPTHVQSAVCRRDVSRQTAVQRAFIAGDSRRKNAPRLLDTLFDFSWIAPGLSSHRTRLGRWVARSRATVDSSLSPILRSRQSYGRRGWHAWVSAITGIAREVVVNACGRFVCAWAGWCNEGQASHDRSPRENTESQRGAATHAGFAGEIVTGAQGQGSFARTSREVVSQEEGDTAFAGTQGEDSIRNDREKAGYLRGDWRNTSIDNGSSACSWRERGVSESIDTEKLPLQRVSLPVPVAVYNFQTTTGNYIANRLLVHNCDLHARHAWLVAQRADLTARLMGDPDYFDAKIAGWWLWGICAWIGSGWCSGNGPWQSSDGRLVDTRLQAEGTAGRGINRNLPRLGDAGLGINRKLPHLGDAGRGAFIADWFTALSVRLRDVRVCCGDWTRVMTNSVTIRHPGITGVLLDPPYADTAGRDGDLYAVDCQQVAHAAREWALAHGDDPRLRIALCGYEGEHAMPASWSAFTWKANGGYGNLSDKAGRANATRERIWFSPHCLSGRNRQIGLVLEAAA